MNIIKYLGNEIKFSYYKKKADEAIKNMELHKNDEDAGDFVKYAKLGADYLKQCLICLANKG